MTSEVEQQQGQPTRQLGEEIVKCGRGGKLKTVVEQRGPYEALVRTDRLPWGLSRYDGMLWQNTTSCAGSAFMKKQIGRSAGSAR